MIKIAICDDDKNQLFRIQTLVDDFIAAHLTEYEITYSTFQNGADLLYAKDKGENFDIFLLDIIMPFVSGIELADEIRTSNTVARIIFLTSSPEYAVDSYRVEAFYYLLKPVQEEALFSILEKACKDLFKDTEKYIVVKQGKGLKKILLNQLEYAEVVGRSIQYHLKKDEVIKVLGTMQDLECHLIQDIRFIKPHRSYIVNIDFIEGLSIKGITTLTGANIPVSRNIYQQIKKKYIDYSFEGGSEK